MNETSFSKIAAIILIFAFVVGCNTNKNNKKNLDCQVLIKDIGLQSKNDSISYALGYVWALNLQKYLGMNTISYAFYQGVHDYFSHDTTIMGTNAANSYVQEKFEKIRSVKWPANDSSIRLCDIKIESGYDTFSFALGLAWSKGAYNIGIGKISPALIPGLFNSLKNDTSLFSNYNEANNYLMDYVDELRMARFNDIKVQNDKWLEENALREGIVTLPSGLQYKILQMGKGKKVEENDIIECYYTGKLIDGTVFENFNNQPYKFYQFAETKGVSEAVKLMKEGDKWELYLPYKLAYGSGGIYGKVPPFATVIVEIELLKSIKPNY
ncbi:MAG: FKBP-type peptidyl-prolyl cis-trans isomerase [Bacteroidales bacterium]|nr:FKBP-type peptidyl-prolyl cis-trans isomerase [Bacteroidales bacterium]